MGHPIFEDGLNSELEGVSDAKKEKIKKFAQRRTRRALGIKVASKAEAVLAMNKNKFGVGTKTSMDNMNIMSIAHYIRSKVTAGVNPMFNDAVDKVEGVTSISKQKLSSGQNMVIDRIEIGYANDATDKSVQSVDYLPPVHETNAGAPALAMAAILNGEIEILVDSTQVFKSPVKAFVEPPKNGGLKNGFNLDSPIFIPEEKTIQINFIAANGVGLTSGYNYLEVILKGISTRLAS